jgi:hypothetical protein
MRHFTLAVTGIAFAALLSSAPAIAQSPAYNTDNMGWNRGGPYKTDLRTGAVSCFVAPGKEVPCAGNAQTTAPAAQTAAPTLKRQRHARH